MSDTSKSLVYEYHHLTGKIFEFETDRLILRPRGLQDLDACLTLDRQPGVTDFIEGPWGDPVRHRAFVLDRITRVYPAGLGYWSIFTKQVPDRFIGWVLLIPADGKGPDVEIGWRLIPECWGHGYATEAAIPVLKHGLVTAGLDKVIADIDPMNQGSRRVAEKIGMKPTSDAGKPYIRYQVTG